LQAYLWGIETKAAAQPRLGIKHVASLPM